LRGSVTTEPSEPDEPGSELGFVRKYSPCIVRVESTDADGSLGIGTAFHIGDGYLVTARHVVEGRTLTGLTPARDATVSLDGVEIIYPSEESVDLALIKSNFSLDGYMKYTHFAGIADTEKVDHIRIGGHLDDWIDDGLILFDVVVFGYPRIPTSSDSVLVAVSGEVNAVIDPYIGSRRPLFIVSPIARGGFSGGPVLTRNGWLLGVMTSALVTDHATPELGFGAAVSVEALWEILVENRIFPASNVEMLDHLKYAFSISDKEIDEIKAAAASRRAMPRPDDEAGT
jgi:S1-C subfamily serine protease